MAKPFEFRLEKLLGVRRMKEEVAQRELAAAHQAVDDRNRVILELMSQEDAAKKDLRELQQSTIDVQRLRLTGGFLVALERLLQREYEALQNLVKIEIEKRTELIDARKDVRVLERAREKKLQLHRRDLDRQERKFLDEIGQNFAKGA
jgi:flagellar FliJ protein